MRYALDGVQPQLEGEGHFIADNAAVIGRVFMAPRSSVWYSATVRGDCDDITIGEGSNIQDGAILHTDPGFKLTIGRDVTVGHQAMLHGCQIGDNCLIGIQAVILNGAKIGNNCIVGAGALITEGKEYPDGSLIIGTPAKAVRELSEQQMGMITMNAQYYATNAERFSTKLEPLD